MAYIPQDEWIVLYEFREFLRDNSNKKLVDPNGEQRNAEEILNQLDELSSKVPERGTIPFLYNKLIGNIGIQESQKAQGELVDLINHYINGSTFKEYIKPWEMMVSDDSEKKPQNLLFDEKVGKNLAYFFKKPSGYNFLFALSNSMFKNMLSMLGAWRKKAHQMNFLPLEMIMQPSTQKWIYIGVIATLFGLFGLGGVVPFVVGLVGIKALSAFVTSTTIPVISNFFTFLTNSSIAHWVSNRLGLEKHSHFVSEFTSAVQPKTKGVDIVNEGENFEDVSKFNKKNMTNIAKALGTSNDNLPEKNLKQKDNSPIVTMRSNEPESPIVTMRSKEIETDSKPPSSPNSYKK